MFGGGFRLTFKGAPCWRKVRRSQPKSQPESNFDGDVDVSRTQN